MKKPKYTFGSIGRRSKKGKPPTEAEVREAVQRFLKSKGEIKTLPLAVTTPPMIGWQHGQFESLNELGVYFSGVS